MGNWSQVATKYVTRSCTNNDIITAYIFVNMMLFTKENIIFPDILWQDKC